MEDVNREYEILTKGVRQLLGKEAYPAPEVDHGACIHVSDGFVYNIGDPNADRIMLLQCEKCSIQYEVSVETGHIL